MSQSEGWESGNIRRFAAMKTGHTPSRSVPEYWESPSIPWFTLADVWQLRDGRQTYLGETASSISELGLANSAAELLPRGTVILSRTASVGFSGITPRPMATSQDFWNWVCGPTLLPEYLNYQFKAIAPSLRAMNMGSTHQTIYQKDAASIRILVPPLDEQRAIADYLDRETAQIDTLIEEQLRLIALQRERRQAVVDVGVFGLEHGTGERPRPLKLIGRHRAVEPLLGRSPKHWCILRFKAALDRLDERNVDLSQPMMSLKSSGEVVPRSALGERQEPDASSLPKYLVAHTDDLVVNPMWLIGGAIGVTEVDGAVSPDYRVFRSAGRHHPRYLHHLLRSRPYIDQYLLYTRAQTTFDRRIQQPDLNNLPMPTPPMSEQVAIATRIDEQTARIDALVEQTERFIEVARERRSALITAAVTGQIDVRGEVA